MGRKKLFKQIGILVFSIFILNYLASKFYLYSAIWYFDMIMHFLGGFWLGLVSLWFSLPKKLSFSFIFKSLLFVFIVGVAWEVFEIIFYNFLAQSSFDILDTISDVCFDLAGGAFALLYFFIHIMLISKNDVQLP